MLKSLDGLIGIRNVSGWDSSDSGLYVNDLEGITTDQLDKIKDDEEEYEAVGSLWEKIYIRAKNLIDADIRLYMKKYMKRTSILHNIMTGQIYNNTIVSASAKYRGHLFEFPVSGHNLELHLNFGQVNLTAAGTLIIKVFDATTGDLLGTYTKDVSAGLQKIMISEEYPVHEYPRIFVGLDHSIITAYKATDYEIGAWLGSLNRTVPMASSVISDNMSSEDISLILNYHIRCSLDNFVATHIDILTTPFLYKLGLEFMKERLGSDEVNQFTLIDIPQTEKLMAMYAEEYTKTLNNALVDLAPEDDGICFICNHAVNKRIMMP